MNNTDKNLIAIGNAAIDGTVEVSSENELVRLGLIKGTCVFVNGQDPRMHRIFKDYPDYKIDPGGASANAISAYGALGGKGRFIGKTGQDDYGRLFTETMNQYGIEFDTKPTAEIESTFLFSVITPDRERSFLSNHGASHYISPSDVHPEWFTSQSSLIIDGYMLMSDGGPETIFHAIKCAKDKEAEVIFMPCSLTVILEKSEFVQQIISQSDAIICNKDEAFALSGSENFEDIKNNFKWGVVTLGSEGAYYFQNQQDGIIDIPFHPDFIVNTNGAGDNFAGGLIYGLHHGMTIQKSVILGQLCALHVLGKIGARCDYDIRLLIEKITALDDYTAMQKAVDIVNTSEHGNNKIATCLYSGHDWIAKTNYRPDIFKDKNFPIDLKFGNSSQFIHSEIACLLHSKFTPIGSTLCITDPMCPNCAKAMAECGIKHVMIDHKGMEKDFILRRSNDFEELSLLIMRRAGISVDIIHRKDNKKTPLIQINNNLQSAPYEHIRTVSIQKNDNLPSLFNNALQTEQHRSWAIAKTINQAGQYKALIVGEHYPHGSTETDNLSITSEKYRLMIDPLNRLLFQTKRLGLSILNDEIACNLFPSSRDMVNAVGYGLKTIYVGSNTPDHDKDGIDASHGLEKSGIINVHHV